jgi:hypothetical protein
MNLEAFSSLDRFKSETQAKLERYKKAADADPSLRNNEVWWQRIAELQQRVGFPELERRYLEPLRSLAPRPARKGLAMLTLALHCFESAGERSMWGFCLRAANEALELDHERVVMWFNNFQPQDEAAEDAAIAAEFDPPPIQPAQNAMFDDPRPVSRFLN